MANNFPNISPSLNLDMVNGIYVDPRVTFTRAGGRTYYGQEVVKAEENLLKRNAEFNNAEWTKQSCSITADSVTAPDGTMTADTVVTTNTSVAIAVFAAPTNLVGAGGQPITISFFAKANTASYIQFVSGATMLSGGRANFDLATGVVGTLAGTGLTSSITALADGWYRCVVTIASASGGPSSVVFFIVDSASAGTGANYTGTTGNSLYLWGAQVEQRSSATAYTATTTQPITRYQRQLKTAAANEWPREFDPVTGECLGRSVWESRTNLLLRSEEFDNAYWIKTRTSILANQIIAPDGTLSMDKLVENTDNNTHLFDREVTGLSSGATHTYSVFLKAAERSMVRISRAGGAVASAFNLSTGTVTNAAGSTGVLTNLGNGIFRCSITFAIVGTSTNIYVELQTSSSTSAQLYTGDGYSGIYIWGAQLEAGAFATPYIPTVAAQVTRLADSAVMTGVNFSSWYRQDEGCILAEYSRVIASVAAANDGLILQIDDGANSNRILAGNVNNGGNSSITDAVVTGGSSQEQTFPLASGFVANTFYKQSFSYKTNDFKGCVNGGTVTTDTLGVTPVVTQIKIGQQVSASFLNGYIKRLTYYPQALTSANLQAVTR